MVCRVPLLLLLLTAAGGCVSTAHQERQPGSREAVACRDIGVSGARCWLVSVYENRATRGRSISIRVAVLPATGAPVAADPVFYLAGGPGQAATDQLRGGWFHAGLRANRDLVFMDQRGTGESHALTCRFYGRSADPQSYFTEFMPLDRVRACRAELSPHTDLTQYTTAAAVEDLDEVRAALGYERINLIGGSYGTRLALEYLRTHGSHVRTAVLESVVTPSSVVPEDFGHLAQRGLDAVLEECIETSACRAAFPDIRAEAKAVFDRLRAQPRVGATVADPAGRPARVTLSRENVAEAIRYMTYSSRDAGRVPLYLHTAYNGDFSPIAQFLLHFRRHGTFDALYLSITCTEDVPFVPADAAERDDPTYLSGYRVREQRAACAEWPRGAVPATHRQPVVSNVPVLLISGSSDPVTPPESGVEVARTLHNALHVVVPHAAHTAFGLRGAECVGQLEHDAIVRGALTGLDTSCVARIARDGFATGL